MIRPLYKLKKCPAGVAPGKYSASVMHNYALGTQQVVQERAGTATVIFSASAEGVEKQEDEGVRGRRRTKGGGTVSEDGLKCGSGCRP